jgi:hypothetical protein
MNNVLGYVSTLSNKVLFPNQYFIYPTQGASSSISLIQYIFELGIISYLSKLIILELQKLQWAYNNTKNLL